jgi:hypothetical protein
MFGRLKAAIGAAADQQETPLQGIEPEGLGDIDFRSLDPGVQPAGAEGALLCPVTRKELRAGDAVYQCRACRTSYSEAGWRFLRDVDRGRCCACRRQRTVFPLAQGY